MTDEQFADFLVEQVHRGIQAALEPIRADVSTLKQAVERAAPREDTERALAALTTRIDELPTPKDGEPGVVDMDAVAVLVQTRVDEVATTLRGRLEDEVTAIAERTKAQLDEHVAGIPVPADGKDVDMEAVRALVIAATDEARATLGSEMVERVAESVSTAVAALPPAPQGEKGADADMEVVVDLVEAATAKAVAAAVERLPVAKDGVGVVDGTITRDGELVLTLSNGALLELGCVVGKDADPPEVIHGKDGFGFEDMAVEFDGERTIELVFTKGEEVKRFSFELPTVIDRGVYRPETEYAKGDGVTWAGSFWIAQEKTSDKPGDGSTGWRLAVKKGRDGRGS